MKSIDKRYLKKLKNYWTKMEKSFTQNISMLDMTTWFDMYHIHTDWDGKGNNNPINRKNSIILAYRCLQHTENLILRCPNDIQTWLFIHEDSFEDAIYLHTKNENNSSYPYNFEGKNTYWNVADNKYLNEIVDTNRYKIGKMINKHGITYIVTNI